MKGTFLHFAIPPYPNSVDKQESEVFLKMTLRFNTSGYWGYQTIGEARSY